MVQRHRGQLPLHSRRHRAGIALLAGCLTRLRANHRRPLAPRPGARRDRARRPATAGRAAHGLGGGRHGARCPAPTSSGWCCSTCCPTGCGASAISASCIPTALAPFDCCRCCTCERPDPARPATGAQTADVASLSPRPAWRCACGQPMQVVRRRMPAMPPETPLPQPQSRVSRHSLWTASSPVAADPVQLRRR